jgi:hypothetical protein
MSAVIAPKHVVPEKKPVKFSNLLLGAGLNLFEVTTLGQPLEVTKTTMAANRGDSFAGALGRIWGRGGVLGCMLSFLSVHIFSIFPSTVDYQHPW